MAWQSWHKVRPLFTSWINSGNKCLGFMWSIHECVVKVTAYNSGLQTASYCPQSLCSIGQFGGSAGGLPNMNQTQNAIKPNTITAAPIFISQSLRQFIILLLYALAHLRSMLMHIACSFYYKVFVLTVVEYLFPHQIHLSPHLDYCFSSWLCYYLSNERENNIQTANRTLCRSYTR